MRGKSAVEKEFMLHHVGAVTQKPKIVESLFARRDSSMKLEISFKQLLGYAKFSVIEIYLPVDVPVENSQVVVPLQNFDLSWVVIA